MNETRHYYCIAHAPFNWTMPEFMTMVGSGDYVPATGLAMSKLLTPEKAMANRYLGEYLVLFELRRRLLAEGADGFVGVCHYRRFALTDPIGVLTGFNHHAHPDMLSQIRPEHFYGDGKTPIVPVSVAFPGSVLQQYQAHCDARDLLLFFGDAVDCGVISSQEAADFLSSTSFITAPTVSYIPVTWFVEIVHDLELVMSRYFRHHYMQRPGYADRSMAFCCERLQAYLLSKRIAAWGPDKVISRPLVLLSEAHPRT